MYIFLNVILAGLSIWLFFTKKKTIAACLSTAIAVDCIVTDYLVLTNIVVFQDYSKPALVLIPILIVLFSVDTLSLVRELDPGSHF